MRLVHQTKFGEPDGNCFAACLATLLELGVDEVPNPKGDRWFLEVCEWLAREHGMMLVEVAWPVPPRFLGSVACVANGDGPRGVRHSVLWRDGGLLHDPHPDGAGLDGEPDTITLIVPLDAGQALRGLQLARQNLELAGLLVWALRYEPKVYAGDDERDKWARLKNMKRAVDEMKELMR